MVKEKFYIPHFRIENNELVPVDYQGMKAALCVRLEKLDTENFYFTAVQKYYRGSFYEEETLTVFEEESTYDIFATFYIQTIKAYDACRDTIHYYETGYDMVSFNAKTSKTS